MISRDPVRWNLYKETQLQQANVSGPNDRSMHYLAQCFSFAENWADIMEAGIAQGRTVEGCATEASFMANAATDGMTLAMYQFAVRMLASFWSMGEELMEWHNKRFHLDDAPPVPHGKLVDCAVVSTQVGSGMIVADYSHVMSVSGRYENLRMRTAAELLCRGVEAHYKEFEIDATRPPSRRSCPSCLFSLSSVDEKQGKPRPGDVSMCFTCGAILMFERNMDFSVISAVELREMMEENPQDFIELVRVWLIVRNRVMRTKTQYDLGGGQQA